MRSELHNQKYEPSRQSSSHVRHIIHNFPLPVWAVAATVSILSSRYLFVELNIHYPLHLHLLQLAVASIIAVACYLQQEESTFLTRSSTRTAWREWLSLTIIAALMAAATVSSVQAILHSRNLPTLLMLAVISPCAEAGINLVQGQSPPSLLEIARVAFASLGCAGILLGEYRLLVPALQSAIPAVVLAGAARAYRSSAIDQSSTIACDPKRMRILFCGAGLAITGTWALFRGDESWALFFHALRMGDIPLLILNCAATAIAMLLGQSVLLPLGDVTNDSINPQNDHGTGEMLALVTIVGVVGIQSTLVLRRSYMTWAQFWCFFTVVAFTLVKVVSSKLRDQHTSSRVYSVVPSRHFDDNEMDASGSIDMPGSYGRQQNFFRRSFNIIIALTIPSIWIGYLSLNFSEHIHQNVVQIPPILDTAYSAEVGVELVISMYKEPVDDVARLISTIKAMPKLHEASVHIYVKDNNTDTDWIRMGTGATKVTTIPNVGREGETYVYHILHNWDTLARHTFFLQADIHNPREFYPRIRDYFDPTRTGMLNLGWPGQVCNCETCGDRYGFEDTNNFFPTLHSRINNATTCENVLLSYKGQFIASAKRIRGVDKAVYTDLRNTLIEPNSWARQEPYSEGRSDTMDAPMFGYLVERIWNVLMQCNDMDVAWKCASLVSGRRAGGTVEDCQCFDS